MTESFFLSNLGVPFALHATYRMRWFSAGLPKNEVNVLIWFVYRDANDQLQIMLGADPIIPPNSKEDELDGMRFYLAGKQQDIDLLCEDYFIDYDKDKEKLKLTKLKKM